MTQLANSFSNLDDSDIEYAQLKILQTASPIVTEGKAKAGVIINTLTGEVYESIELIILGVRKEFRIWPQCDSLSKFPEYISDDMQTLIHLNSKTGEQIGEEPLKFSEKWINRTQNKCAKTQYYFLAAIVGSLNFAFFRVGGVGYKRARNFLTKARYSGKQLYQFVTKFSVGEENTTFGKKFAPDFEITNTPLPEEWSIDRCSQSCEKFIKSTRALPVPE